MELPIVSTKAGASTDKINVSKAVFDYPYRKDLVHQVVTAYQAGGRAGTKANKSRSDVSGGGIKPWRQKGTGRARAGTTRGPLWRTGGVTFAARPRNFAEKVNKKVYRAAMRAILSELVRQERLIIVDEFAVTAPKTREAIDQFKQLALSEALLVVETILETDPLYLAMRNLRYFDLLSVGGLNPVSLINSAKVLLTVSAVKKIEAWLSQ